jgi:hypothetical protein
MSVLAQGANVQPIGRPRPRRPLKQSVVSCRSDVVGGSVVAYAAVVLFGQTIAGGAAPDAGGVEGVAVVAPALI